MEKVISFDIWDTIIKRKCHPQETILKTMKYIYIKYYNQLKDEYKNIYKLLTTRNEIESNLCIETEKQGFDRECKIEKIFETLINETFVDKSVITIDELLKVEIKNEKDVIYINPEILPIFEKYKDLDMYCISDFYMGEKSLKEILNYLNLPIKIKKIYSSADFLLNKKSGRLYDKFESDLNIQPKDHIHVGDNIYSDIEIANSKGIKTIKTTTSIFPFASNYDRKMEYSFNGIYKDNKNEKNRIFNSGVDIAPLLYFFVYNIIETAIKKDIKTIYYQSREGETFIKIHKLIEENNPFGIEIPKAKVMEVSRMATFAPSLKEFSIRELLRLWSQYKKQSIKALFKTINIEIGEYQKYFEKYKLDINTDINEPWFDPKIQKLFDDKEFTNQVEKELKNKKIELGKYFKEQLEIENTEGDLFVVDIGWRGTIQDNLAYIFDKKNVGGYYLTLFDYYNYQPENTYKISFIDDKDVRDNIVCNIITLLEWIYNPGTGSVVEYKNGLAIRKAKEKEMNVVEKYIKPLQEGMFEGCKVINEYIKCHPYEAKETKNVVYKLLKSIKENPSRELVEAYYSMVFNDTFGSNEYVEKGKKLTPLQKINVIRCRNELRKESWQEAYMKYNKVGYMKALLKVKSKIRGVRKNK